MKKPKVTVKEVPSKIKEIKKETPKERVSLEEEVSPESQETATHTHVPTLRPTERTREITNEQNVSQVSQQRRTQEARPVYEGSRAYVSPSLSGQPQQEVAYEDPMVASARRSATIEKPTALIREEFMHAESQHNAARFTPQKPILSGHPPAREQTYTVEQNREKAQKKRRYPWEA